ncbi:hypothetical protein GGR51DRAFT_168269 [Nemania sp. FL0031]|nr:hypothetical protein GGR51DRAFT_168269 [Nemania sp. FL0031]
MRLLRALHAIASAVPCLVYSVFTGVYSPRSRWDVLCLGVEPTVYPFLTVALPETLNKRAPLPSRPFSFGIERQSYYHSPPIAPSSKRAPIHIGQLRTCYEYITYLYLQSSTHPSLLQCLRYRCLNALNDLHLTTLYPTNFKNPNQRLYQTSRANEAQIAQEGSGRKRIATFSIEPPPWKFFLSKRSSRRVAKTAIHEEESFSLMCIQFRALGDT